MWPHLPLVLVIVAAAAAGPPSARAAQLGPDTARVVTLAGRVSVERAGELWALMSGQAVSAGQVVVTGPDGYAQLELSDRSTIEVFPNSRLIFRANRFSWRDLLDLYLGKIRLQIQRLSNDDQPYRVTSPTAVISVRGTVFEVEVGATQDTTIHVETGSVSVRHRLLPGKEVVVESGRSLRVVPNVPLTAAKLTVPLVVVGKIVRIAGETLARVDRPGGKSNGGGGSPSSNGGSGPSGGSPSSTSSSGSGSSGGDPGSNEPASVPGQDGKSAPPGDVIGP